MIPEVESDRPRLTAEIAHRLGELGSRRLVLAPGERRDFPGQRLPDDRRPEPSLPPTTNAAPGAAGEVVGGRAVFGHGRQPARSVRAVSRSPGPGASRPGTTAPSRRHNSRHVSGSASRNRSGGSALDEVAAAPSAMTSTATRSISPKPSRRPGHSHRWRDHGGSRCARCARFPMPPRRESPPPRWPSHGLRIRPNPVADLDRRRTDPTHQGAVTDERIRAGEAEVVGPVGDPVAITDGEELPIASSADRSSWASP